MWRYWVGAGAALLLALGGFLIFRGGSARTPALAGAPSLSMNAGAAETPLPDVAPEANAKTREEKRFNRYDKDRDDAISREEYFAARRKAFAKLDANGDGRLSFEEWAVKAIDKFGGADADKSSALTRAEFATTAPKRKAPAARCACAKPEAPAERDEDEK